MLKQTLQQKLLQKLSPQQIQLMKLLQLPTVALEQRIKEEMEANPALEDSGDESDEEDMTPETDAGTEDDSGNLEATEEDQRKNDEFSLEDYMGDDDEPAYKYQVKNTGPDDERKDIPFAGGISFQEQLESQLGLRNLTENQHVIGLYLIGNIDDDGYLRRELSSVVDDLAFSQNVIATEAELKEVLAMIQEFDPPGVGARSLQECLLLQLKRKSPRTENIALAILTVEKHMEEFSKKHYDRIEKKLDISGETLKKVIQEILKLNPKPGSTYSDSQKNIQQIIPDFIISTQDGKAELTLNSRNAPELKVSKTYNRMLEEYSRSKDKSSREAVMFVKQKIDGARWFIDAIKQRQDTLLLTMKAIMEYQYDFFLEGDETKLRPMILKDIAEKVGLDISTVSRVANSKYVQTPFGTYLLKFFFSESLSTDSGEEVSTREVKKILDDCISAEDKQKPLTDDRLTLILKEKGYNIARRTVAKYREQLNIPVARMRKEI